MFIVLNKKLYRSRSDRMLSGVCGGLAEYFQVDATLIRLVYATVTLFTAIIPGILFYIIALIIIPDEY